MRVGGPSLSQVRGMRSEGEMGERVREETHTSQEGEKKERKKKIRDGMEREMRELGLVQA